MTCVYKIWVCSRWIALSVSLDSTDQIAIRKSLTPAIATRRILDKGICVNPSLLRKGRQSALPLPQLTCCTPGKFASRIRRYPLLACGRSSRRRGRRFWGQPDPLSMHLCSASVLEQLHGPRRHGQYTQWRACFWQTSPSAVVADSHFDRRALSNSFRARSPLVDTSPVSVCGPRTKKKRGKKKTICIIQPLIDPPERQCTAIVVLPPHPSMLRGSAWRKVGVGQHPVYTASPLPSPARLSLKRRSPATSFRIHQFTDTQRTLLANTHYSRLFFYLFPINLLFTRYHEAVPRSPCCALPRYSRLGRPR